jgi:hypothetical protein
VSNQQFAQALDRPRGKLHRKRPKKAAAQKLLRGGIGILKVARTLKIGTGTVSKNSIQLKGNLF